MMLDASRMGADDADNYLGYMLVNGVGCQKHYNVALSYFKKAAVKFNPTAEYHIGRFYLYGWGDFTMKINRFKAYYWLNRSVEHGSKEAEELLKKLADEAREYLTRQW
ncbi:MAG: sel1 repeat family protein [Lentisphaerae bacterium]|nr:sel1 repeat family protein [Lentisphaerota bacterium]